jgi:hypothetical protein
MIDFRIQLIIVVVVLYILNKTLTGVTEKLGLTKSKEDKENEAKIERLSNLEFWKPSYYREMLAEHGRAKIALSKPETVEKVAKQFYDAKGIFNDDETKVYGMLRALRYDTQLSQISERFFQMYKKDLYNYIASFMNEKEMLEVNKLVSNLKNGKIK